MTISDDFEGSFHKHWTRVTTGGGYMSINKSILRLGYDVAASDKYTDSQIDDYTMLSRKEYVWKPPLRMTVKARASNKAADANSTEQTEATLRGTAGFGFWNRPFTMQGNWFTMPESVWFFYASPPSNMALSTTTPGWGWKAQVVHGAKLSSAVQSVPLAASMGYGKITGNSMLAGKWLQKFSGTSEKLIQEDITKWHEYILEWRVNEAIFYIDGQEVHRAPFSPTKPLGFVAWLDNAYAIATPRGEIKFGRMNAGKQWLDLDSVKIESLKD